MADEPTKTDLWAIFLLLIPNTRKESSISLQSLNSYHSDTKKKEPNHYDQTVTLMMQLHNGEGKHNELQIFSTRTHNGTQLYKCAK